ncbi:hypothetical protein [Microbacterium arabinogalactanolyticum]|uniref:hypothetical protein n=1 Tax=Microbacterium arabinogalactanolyticum TaxID=69365 RepID=UPI0025574361|nr:hypothetical protein [Microbacterium arabinogalactanolyticum]GLC84507.1 hypothetical protein MIAR_10950 [Microbacterium arabinogalactanolyticum]
MTAKLSARDSLEAMIADSPTLQATRAGAVVTLARLLAEQVDASTGGPSTRLAASYLSILKDLRRFASEDRSAPKKASRLALIKQQAADTAKESAHG